MIRTIISRCGGARAIADASAATGRPVSVKAVYAWTLSGIPEWHWPLVRELGGYSVEELHAANEKLRAERHFPKAPSVAVA